MECTPPYVNCGPWVHYQCRFIDCNKCATLVKEVNNRRGYTCGWETEWGSMGNI